eukprot:1566367-Pyramimonas_sp.AAC.1
MDWDKIHESILEQVMIKESVKTGPGKTFFPHKSYLRVHGDFGTNGLAEKDGHYEGEDENGVAGIWVPDVECTHYGRKERQQVVKTVRLGQGPDESVAQKQARVADM